jgi:hypothetical protein
MLTVGLFIGRKRESGNDGLTAKDGVWFGARVVWLPKQIRMGQR